MPVVEDGFLSAFAAAWLPLFVAMDPLGLVPLFLALTDDMTTTERRRIGHQAVATAGIIALSFMLLGKWFMDALGITVPDFQIAGGLILFLVSSRDLLGGSATPPKSRADVGIVPVGTPLIAGPATLATLVMLMEAAGIPATLAAFLVNLALVFICFHFSATLVRLIGERGLRAFSKITSLLLAAFAVSMVRRGFQSL